MLALAIASLASLDACAAAPAAPAVNLVDDSGNRWALADQHKPVVLTFGFTHCADTCPATLAKLSRLVDGAGTPAEIAFVTVDPQRDTPVVMRRFVKKFETPRARIVGLTGTPEQIDAVESAYHVWAQKVPGNHKNGGYDIAHAAVLFFIDASGRTRSLHDDGDPDAVLARALREAAT